MVKTFVSALAVIFTISSVAAAKPRNYDECILDNISNAQTNAAVTAVRQACRSLFPLPKEKDFVPEPAQEANFKWKTVNLDKVNASLSGGILEAEVINDTDFFIDTVTVVYKLGDCLKPTSAAVAQVQKKLNAKNIDAGRVDGKMGERTRKAIRAYQKATGKMVDGKISEDLLRSLDIDTEIGWLKTTSSTFIFPGRSRQVTWRLNNNQSHICWFVTSAVKEYE